ncbi:hypothetical protein EDD75_0453 [Thermodesulfitimonas autotrophica]|uniref:Uncharacterized protein n=1 Tax=Thermodesulfitimonas autotrophica TaxID=1894989 RepID=A0A3N5AXA2_9THEO|nr:hypothetical protein [Thermodesulfitimonas autotrophica]RPF49634.1 hypothetical protein EDD75_0453 [Thermodesulfitimonas autotrophica]
MGERWQWLKVIAGLLFLGAAALLYLSFPRTPKILVLVFLFVFLGLYYPFSALFFRWMLKNIDDFRKGREEFGSRKKGRRT